MDENIPNHALAMIGELRITFFKRTGAFFEIDHSTPHHIFAMVKDDSLFNSNFWGPKGSQKYSQKVSQHHFTQLLLTNFG